MTDTQYIEKTRQMARDSGFDIEQDSLLDEMNTAMFDCMIQDCIQQTNTDHATINCITRRHNVLEQLSHKEFQWGDAVKLILAEYRSDNMVLVKRNAVFEDESDFASELHGVEMHVDKVPSWYIKPRFWDTETNVIACFLSEGDNVRGFYNSLHCGPKGTGKTDYANALSWYLFGKPAVILDPAQTPGKVTGGNVPIAKADGEAYFKYVASRIAKALPDEGVICIDEYDAASKQCMLLYNTILASGQMEAGDDYVYRNKHCIIICCANSVGNGGDGTNYTRNVIDASTMSRFTMTFVDTWDGRVARKLDAIIERPEGEEVPGINEFCSFCEALDKACLQSGNIKYTTSYRTVMNYTLLMQAGTRLSDMMDVLIVRGMPKIVLGGILQYLKALDVSKYTEMLNEIYEEMPAVRSF